MVEFALILPLLLVLLLGVADFGRVFATGIVMEAAARNAAEVAAQEYLQIRRESAPPTSADYDRIHDAALQTVCDEAQPLPNRVASGGACTMPAAAVCIHDAAGELPGYVTCGAGASGAPPQCDELRGSWPATEPAPGMLAWVEVRVCYRFTTLFNLQDMRLPFGWSLSLGDVWLERTRTFAVADY